MIEQIAQTALRQRTDSTNSFTARLIRRMQHHTGPKGGGRGKDREIPVFSRLDIGHKDFLGDQFVNCRPFPSHHKVRMDFVFFIPPPPFYEGTRAEFDASLDSCWYGSGVLLFSILVKTDQKDKGRDGRSVLKECYCAMIDCLYDYVGRCQENSSSSLASW